MVSGTRALPEYFVVKIERGFRAAAPKGLMTYAFTYEEFSPPPPPGSWGRGDGRIWQNSAEIGRSWLNMVELGRIRPTLGEFG